MATLESSLLNVPILREMLGMEQYEQGKQARDLEQTLGILSSVGKLAELQNLPARRRLLEAQATGEEFKVEDTRGLRDLQARLPEILARGDSAEIQAAIARLAPQQWVAGQFKNPMEGLPDTVKLQEIRDRYEQSPDPRLARRAAELTGQITQRSTSDKQRAEAALIEMGTHPYIARGLVNGTIIAVTRPDGSQYLVDKRTAQPPAVPGEPAPVPVPAPGAGAGAGASPYAALPPPPGGTLLSAPTKPRQLLNEEAQQLAKLTADKQIPKLDQATQAIEAIFGQFPEGDTPGLGYGKTTNPVAGAVYGGMSALPPKVFPGAQKFGEQAQRNRANVQRWANVLVRESAGLAQTNTELENAKNELQAKMSGSEIDLRNAFKDWRKAFLATKANIFSGFDPQVVYEYYQRHKAPATFTAPDPESAKELALELKQRGFNNIRVQAIEPEAPPAARPKAEDFLPRRR
jgi:hypothetical protein